MSNIKQIIIATALLIATLASCKPSEENYRAAYQTAKAKEDTTPLEETIYSNIRKEARPKNVIVGNDTIPMITQYISFTTQAGGDINNFHRYNIVVAEFKQIFNAKAMLKRVVDAGYTDAFVVQTREPLYYVVAQSVSNPADAARILEEIRTAKPVPMKDPAPLILSSPR